MLDKSISDGFTSTVGVAPTKLFARNTGKAACLLRADFDSGVFDGAGGRSGDASTGFERSL